MRVAPAAVVVTLLASLLAGCKSGNAPEASTVISIVITPSGPVLRVGQTIQLTAKVLGPAGIPQGVNWRSLSTAVATVSATGLVTAVSEGTATVRALWFEDAEEFGSIEVSVTDTPVGEGRRGTGGRGGG